MYSNRNFYQDHLSNTSVFEMFFIRLPLGFSQLLYVYPPFETVYLLIERTKIYNLIPKTKY